MEESYIQLPSGESLFTRTWHPVSKPRAAIILIHGLSDHSGRFIYPGETLSDHGFVFIAPDLRGNGRSPGKRGHFDSFDQVMDDMKAVVEFTKSQYPGIPVFLYGQSMGGGLVISFALKHPELIIGSIASSPWLRLAKPPSGIVRAIASLIKPFAPSLLMPNGLKSSDLCHDKVVQQAYDNDPLIHWKVSLSTFFIINKSGERAINNAASLHIPLLLLHGNADQITSYDASVQFAEICPDKCTFKSWSGQFHELHNEPIKEQVLEFIVQWIESLLKRKGFDQK